MVRPEPRLDRWMLLEVTLVLILLVAATMLFWRPAAEGVLSPRWWHGAGMVALFFAIVVIHGRRRHSRSREALHRVIREDAASREESEP